MIRLRLLLMLPILLAVTTAAQSNAEEILYARHPALSPDGSTIAFSYMGDIWLVPSEGGEARRLTVHEAEDVQPHFSPDGRWIAFSSRRFNNYDVFVIPSQGGTARQLTVHSAPDYATGWFPGSDSVVFRSRRDGTRGVYKVSLDGCTPTGMVVSYDDYVFDGRVSADSRYLVFANGSAATRWWRRDLRGGANGDIFLMDRQARIPRTQRLTNWEKFDLWPVLNTSQREVYFVSNRDTWAQVWKVSLDGGRPTAMTSFDGDGVQWLNSNPQGTMLVFEQGFHIWIMDPVEGTPRMVPIEICTDQRTNTVDKRTFTGDVEWYALSADEKKVAVIIHGEIFVAPAEDPELARRVTFTAARERFLEWDKDSRTLYYASDRNGNYDIFSVDVTTGVEKQLSHAAEDETKPLPSPDGRYLAYLRGVHQIIRLDLDKGKERTLVSGDFLDMGVEDSRDFDWSPDSRWLAFPMAGPTHETDIYVVDAEGTTHNISKYVGWNFSPRFSADGKKLYFSSWTRAGVRSFEIDLIHEPMEFAEATLDSLFLDPDDGDEAEKKDKKKDGDKGDVKGEETPDVIINFERIERRRHSAFDLDAPSTYPALTPDGEKYVFVASLLDQPEIWAVNTEDDPDLKQLTHSKTGESHLTVTDDSKWVYYLEDGRLKKIGVDGNKKETLSFTAEMDINRPANNRQKYYEAWQMLNTYFYDTTYHGVDWPAMRDKYAPLLDYVATEAGFRDVIFELMGELSASHMYIYPSAPGTSPRVATGELGIEFDGGMLEREGRFVVADVLPESPADLVGVKRGDVIRSIDGTPLDRTINCFTLMAGTRDKRMKITLNRDGKELAFELKPVGSVAANRYTRWLLKNRRMVDSLSGGRLAYLHIPSMSMPWQKRFEEELVSIAEHKDAMIIDVRNNGGGWTAVNILGELVKSPYILRAFRGREPVSENKYRSKAYEKPMLLMINGYSGSNAEIFAEGFRKLGLGKIVGVPTAGGVIGTASYTLIDGTRIRRPSTGAFTADMENTELVPRRPDVFIELLPDDYLNGRDPQLEKAVGELLKDL